MSAFRGTEERAVNKALKKIACAPEPPHNANSAQTAQAGGWRKVGEASRLDFAISTKPLKSLALPRGIEPLFQP